MEHYEKSHSTEVLRDCERSQVRSDVVPEVGRSASRSPGREKADTASFAFPPSKSF